MKKFLFIFAVFAVTSPRLEAQMLNDRENQDIKGLNKKQPLAYGILPDKKANNPMIQSLNNICRFKWSHDLQLRPADSYKANCPVEKWDDILNPVNRELQGFGTTIDRNIAYIRNGENKLAVDVCKHCVESYPEDPDMRRLSCIFRDVNLNIHNAGGDDSRRAKTMNRYLIRITNPISMALFSSI